MFWFTSDSWVISFHVPYWIGDVRDSQGVSIPQNYLTDVNLLTKL